MGPDGHGRSGQPRQSRTPPTSKKVRLKKKHPFHSDGSGTDGYFRTLDGYFRTFGRVGYSVQTKKILLEKKSTNHCHNTLYSQAVNELPGLCSTEKYFPMLVEFSPDGKKTSI